MSRKNTTEKKLVCRLGAILGGLAFGLTLCIAIPLTVLGSLLLRRRRDSGPPGPAAAAAAAKPDPSPFSASFTIDVRAAEGDSGGDDDGPPSQHAAPFITTELALLLPLFRQHGTGSLSYAALVNGEYAHLYCPPSTNKAAAALALVAAPDRYGVRAVMAVGDPLAPRERWAEVGRAFLRLFPRGFFGYASAEFARALLDDDDDEGIDEEQEEGSGSGCSGPKKNNKPSLCVNDWGLSTRVPIFDGSSSSSSSSGRRLPGCRTAQQDARRALKSGLRVREVPLPELLLAPAAAGSAMLRPQLREVSDRWLATKVTRDRELRVFCRSLDFLEDDDKLRRDAEAGTRLFVAERQGGGGGGEDGEDGDGGGSSSSSSTTYQVDAFAVLDPQCEGGQVVGWVLASSRARPGAHRGALKLLVQHVLTSGALLQQQRKDDDDYDHRHHHHDQPPVPCLLDLGLAPFAGIAHPKDCPFGGGAPWMRLAARFLFACADGRLYSFKGLAMQKRLLGGGGGSRTALYCLHRGGQGWAPTSVLFVVELYAMMGFVGFVGEGPLDTVLRLWGVRRR